MVNDISFKWTYRYFQNSQEPSLETQHSISAKYAARAGPGNIGIAQITGIQFKLVDGNVNFCV